MYSLTLTSLLLRRARQLQCSTRGLDIDPYQCFWSEALANMQTNHRKAVPKPEFDNSDVMTANRHAAKSSLENLHVKKKNCR